MQVVSSSNANIAADGTISYTDASVEGKVTLRLSAAGETTDAFDVDVTVAAHVKSKAELIDETAALITFDAIKGSNTSADDVRFNLSTRVPRRPGRRKDVCRAVRAGRQRVRRDDEKGGIRADGADALRRA